jgi:SSS family solute:Na+ symporter
LVAAALMAALMSTVSGALNSIATLFSYDIYRRWRPQTPDHRLVIVGRIATFVAMIAAMLWSPMLEHFESIFQGIVALICYIAPPITAVFVLGLFWRKASSTGAIITLWVGFFMGLATFLLDWFKKYTHWSVPSMMMTFYLFLFCCAILCFVSALKPHQHTAESEQMVWSDPLDALRGRVWPGVANYKFLAALLFIVMVGLYTIFR